MWVFWDLVGTCWYGRAPSWLNNTDESDWEILCQKEEDGLKLWQLNGAEYFICSICPRPERPA